MGRSSAAELTAELRNQIHHPGLSDERIGKQSEMKDGTEVLDDMPFQIGVTAYQCRVARKLAEQRSGGDPVATQTRSDGQLH
jgi:hypothetical protein